MVLKFFFGFFLRGFGHDLNVFELKTKKSFFLVNISTSGTSTVKPFNPVTGSTTFWCAFGLVAFGALFGRFMLASFWRALVSPDFVVNFGEIMA